ncbi:MAG: DNA N-6-adenine-methyltransferase [Chloroflexota bacterium]
MTQLETLSLELMATTNHPLRNPAQLINQDSGKVEYYTPEFITHAAREVMGGIDLDPASSPEANQRVEATEFYTLTDNGLAQRWYGRVWMNHPFGRNRNSRWINKLIWEYEVGEVEQACCLTFASTSEKWFKPLFAYPICFLSPRTNFILPDGSVKRGVTKGSVVTYLGHRVVAFVKAFSPLGKVMLPAWRIEEQHLAWHSQDG